MLGNLTRGLNSLQKRWLYRCCALSIALYGFQLWYYNKAPLNYSLRALRKMQWRVVLWISGAFWTSPIAEIEAIAGLIPIYLYLKKLYNRSYLWGFSLPLNHIIKSILSPDGSTKHILYSLYIKYLTPKHRLHLNSLLIDMENRNNEFLSSFSLGNWLKDSFPDQFSFHPYSWNIKNYIKNLDNITFEVSSNPFASIVIFDANIKNQVATSISHIHSCDKPIIKTIHWTISVTTTEAGLFAICCGINQAVSISNVKHIIVITDFIHTAKSIFNSSIHPYQIHSAAISQELREFFMEDNNNYIEFWDCSSKLNWPLHSLVDKDTRSFDSSPNFPCKLSWDFCKKCNCDSILA